MKILSMFLLLASWLWPAASSSTFTPTPHPVVHAVLFYSPNCGHCYLVITEVLPPFIEKYGDQLSIVGVDVTQPDGQALFLAALQHFNLERSGVPFLVVGDTYLIGSIDIPEKFPGLTEQYLSQGGVDWPAIPGLAETLATAQPTESPTVTPAPVEATPTLEATTSVNSPTLAPSTLTPTPGLLLNGEQIGGPWANFARDLLGNSLAVVILAGMIVSFGGSILVFQRLPDAGTAGSALTRSWSWLIPILCLIGLGVAGYLAYVETAQVEAVCGPVGDCNTVQQSEYARLFGVLPIGILGMAGYGMILLVWVVGRSAGRRLAAYSSLALLGLTTFGLLFSIYLTFLEPFVIGATCAWCLTSAIIITLLLWLALPSGRQAIIHLSQGDSHA